MKVVFFKANFFNPKALLISAITWSKITHAALLFNGEDRLYDASESRGNVDYNKSIIDFKNQKIIVYDIPEDEKIYKQYALSKKGVKYDWKGIMGWFPFLASNDPQTVYCFELVMQTLLTQDTLNGKPTKEIAEDFRKKVFKKPIDSDDILILLERAQLTASYIGKAKDYERPGN